ncbi:hypothetical protein B0H14DRAFT_3461133 [Mycena olivaceomarginata]|nr:hypothetical protein B0H14DRAFT_3461133 [Mycena olivaceomarginata]
MANDSPKAVPSAPPPESYPPFPTDPANLDANGAPPPPGTPYMFPYPPTPGMFTPSSASRPKHRQVKMACTNCAQACKRCDDQRPCLRCQKYGMTDRCVDGQRKERRKGVKRGASGHRPPCGGMDRLAWTAACACCRRPFCNPRHPAPPASAAAPQPFPVPPKGYPHPFYPPMGFLLGPPPPGAEEGAAPVPYFYPYPPFGM